MTRSTAILTRTRLSLALLALGAGMLGGCGGNSDMEQAAAAQAAADRAEKAADRAEKAAGTASRSSSSNSSVPVDSVDANGGEADGAATSGPPQPSREEMERAVAQHEEQQQYK